VSSTTDDNDIKSFMNDIDARKPLSSLREGSQDSPIESHVASKPSDRDTESTHAREATQPILTTASAVDERLQQMSDKFFASVNSIGRRKKDREREGSTGSSTARAPSSGPSTIGRRTLDPISLTSQEGTLDHSPPLSRRQTSTNVGISVALPAAYVRPRLASTSSATSNMSIASGEVLGRMDPEIDDGRRRNSGRDWSG
jgi:autophagy-related protein 13